MAKYKMYLRRTIKKLCVTILTSLILTGCGGGANTGTTPSVVVVPPQVVLTPEREGQSVARMWN